MTVTPTFQAQNPAISGYSLGWASCQAFSAAMQAAFERQVKLVMTGAAVRQRVRPVDTTGGLTHSQVDQSLNDGWGIDVATYYRLSWATAERFVDAGMGMSLSVWYGPIADSRFDAGRGFRKNHEIFVPPGWGAMDPLADGRYGEAYKYRGEPYPRAMLKEAAGKLNIAASGYRALGSGLVYATFTHDKVHSYSLRFDGGEAFWVYRIGPDGRILPGKKGRYAKRYTKDTSARCTEAHRVSWEVRPGVFTSRSLVRILAGGLKDEYVSLPQGALHLEVIS